MMEGTSASQDVAPINNSLEPCARDSLLYAAIEALGEGFVVYDRNDRLVYCNQKALDLYQTTAPFVKLGCDFEDIVRYGLKHGQYREAIGREDEWLAERIALHCNAQGGELLQQLDDGRWLRVKERRTPDGYVVSFRIDVTELVKARDQAERASLAKTRFLSHMSHELRTPLNAVLGMAQLLSASELDARERIDYAHTIIESGQRLLRLINNVLELSRIETGKTELNLDELSPNLLIQDVHAAFKRAANAKGLRLDCIDSAAIADRRYRTDTRKIRQMLNNLVENAIQYTDQGSIRLEVSEYSRDHTRASLEFAVLDTGIGVAHQRHARIFEPFSQNEDSSRSNANDCCSLGLSIVDRLARLMGGEVGLESAPGRGSRFWFRVRVDLLSSSAAAPSPVAPAEPAKAPARRQLGGGPQHFSGRVLIVEDNPVNRKLTQTMLKKLGLEVAVAEDGQQAVDAILGGQRPDLILMDCQMPVLDGYEATTQIRAWELKQALKRLPIIAVTANTFEEDRQHCFDVGMDDFLAKPLMFGVLKKRLEHWLPKPDDATTT